MDQYSSTGSSAKGSSFGGRPPSVQDSEKQLQLGIKYIMEAFENKNAGLVIEVARWKQIASDGNRKITSLEAQINALTHHVERLGRALSAETEEKESMTASHNALLEKYTSLKKEAVKLEHFRKSIVSMIEYSSTSRVRNILDQSFNLNSDLDFQEALARAGEEFGGSLRVITEKKGEPSEDGEDERAVDDEVDEEEDEQAREDGEEEDAAHEQNDDVEELDLDADSAANGDEDEDGEEDEEMATLEQFESTDGGTPDLEVYYTLNRPRASSTSLNPIAPAVSFGMHRNPSDLALLTKQSPSKQLQSPPQGQSATPQSASQRVLTHRNSIDAMGGSFTPTGSGRVRQIIAENKAKSEPQQKRWSLQDAARLAPAVGGGSVDTNNNNQDTSPPVENRSLMNRLRRFSNQNLAGEALALADLQQQLQQPRPFSSNAVRKPHSIEDPTRLPTHHEERPPAYSRVSRTRTPSPTKPMSRSSAVAAANAEMARSASITTSPSKAERERGRERERERGMERERERESRERDTDSTGLEESVVNAFAELYKQIMESLTSDEFAKFAAVVSAFNASQKTAEETVRDVEVIVKSRDLFLRFKALVSRALQEREKAEAAASASAEA